MILLDEIKTLRCGAKELKQFGVTMGAVSVVIAGFLFWRGGAAAPGVAILALFFVVGGLVYRPILKPIYLVWMSLAILLGWVMTRILLCIIFYVVLTPISLLARLVGKPLLDRRPTAPMTSYWNRRASTPFKKSTCERQF